MLGCGSAPPRPVTAAELRARFAKTYNGLTADGKNVKDLYSIDRPLFHQGIPLADGTRVIWFLRGRDQCGGAGPTVTFEPGSEGSEPKYAYEPIPFPTETCSRMGLVKLTAAPNGKSPYTPGENWPIRVAATTKDSPAPMTLRGPPMNGRKSFSFLAFSCNRPYHAEEDGDGISASNVNTLNLLRVLATGASPPAFMMGLGDQVYVDPDPGEDDGYSLFGGDNSEKPRFEGDAKPLLEEVYRAHFAIPPLDQALREIPTLMMWDDHEIRDGWGSRKDDNEAWGKRYYEDARSAFLAFQAKRNGTDTRDRNDPDLDVALPWGDQVRLFLLDTRSSRSQSPQALLSKGQWSRLDSWLDKAANERRDQETLLVIGAPTILFAGIRLGNFVSGAKPDLKDDIVDALASLKAQRKKLLGRLIEHFTVHRKHRLLVLSGDVHESGLIWLTLVDDNGSRVFGHEVITSGLTNTRRDESVWMKLAEFGMPVAGSGDSEVRAWAGGAVKHAPAFAQIFVDQPLSVRVAFHTGAMSRSPSWWKFWASPYDEASLANPATHMRTTMQHYDKFPGWSELNSESVPPVNGKLVVVPLNIGPVPNRGSCKSAGRIDWPLDPCGSLPYKAGRAVSNNLHPMSVWCIPKRNDVEVPQHEHATDWLTVFSGSKLVCSP